MSLRRAALASLAAGLALAAGLEAGLAPAGADDGGPAGSTGAGPPATDTTGTDTTPLLDTVPPALSLPSDPTVEATGPDGAAVSYSASATDAVDGPVGIACTPASGSTFGLGSTTVSCQAVDAAGNAAVGSFTVTVRDTTPPAVGDAADQSLEANGPSGSEVVYEAPSATDAVDGPVPVHCSPASGTTFPLGPTSVLCEATDSRGNTGSSSFSVSVVDTTPPVVTPPADLAVTAGAAVPATDPRIAAFLAGASASDTVDPGPVLANDAPAEFPFGTTTVTFTATDASGNSASATATVRVFAPPPAPPSRGAASPPAPPRSVSPTAVDSIPPPDVVDVRAIPGDHRVALSWRRLADAVRVQVRRSRPDAAATGRIVYDGPGSAYTDRRLRNDTPYRYLVIAFDEAGNRSAGVAVVETAHAALLVSPASGERLTRRPLFRWAPVPRARYYNLQLFRLKHGGRTLVKVLSVWPRHARYRLPERWIYDAHQHHLTAGRYRWYVWPGFGHPSAARYGPLRGESEFLVVRTS